MPKVKIDERRLAFGALGLAVFTAVLLRRRGVGTETVVVTDVEEEAPEPSTVG